ncbi:septum site-determining protein MinC [Paenibacillus beijingensis]|uniref:Probable septum site-determining protein MinC n=1 Tax=Paenibacillus beijingensis TaxID=1126833 RepID=A0A0D5NM35_9BACL|nr:septum site-determining protein MinC [Paenibacillus beijingensis]AJY76062.1 septum site-determining protein MinC [Paenibacillus beijingensis]
MTDKQHITIKGVKEGLVFLFDDQCEFSALLDELHYKMEKSHQQLLSGPLIHVHVKLGARAASDEDKERIRAAIRQRGNLLVQSIESEMEAQQKRDENAERLKMMTGMVRSGQTVEHDGSLLLLGDVNPGGAVVCTGDIFVLGALRGMAHAGVSGREDVIIAASLLRPTQLRIAEVISRPPEEWITGDASMEYAYLTEGVMQIDKMNQLYRMRKDAIVFKGV